MKLDPEVFEQAASCCEKYWGQGGQKNNKYWGEEKLGIERDCIWTALSRFLPGSVQDHPTYHPTYMQVLIDHLGVTSASGVWWLNDTIPPELGPKWASGVLREIAEKIRAET